MLCQVTHIRQAGFENSPLEDLLQMRVRLLRPAKRKTKYLAKKGYRLIAGKPVSKVVPGTGELLAGDTVTVRSRDEILSMLDEAEKYKGCLFIDEMFEFCGNSYRVLKPVEYFFDEAKQKMCRCKNMVLLEDVLCSGRQRLYNRSCDRACFFFWHKDWLIKS